MAEDKQATTPPPDEDADHHNNGRFLHDLAAVNTNIARYLFRFMDADAGRGEPVSADDERQLAEELTELAKRLRGRAGHRATLRPPSVTTDTDHGP